MVHARKRFVAVLAEDSSPLTQQVAKVLDARQIPFTARHAYTCVSINGLSDAAHGDLIILNADDSAKVRSIFAFGGEKGAIRRGSPF